MGERTELSSEDSDADAEEEDTDMPEEENVDVDGNKEHCSRLLCVLLILDAHDFCVQMRP